MNKLGGDVQSYAWAFKITGLWPLERNTTSPYINEKIFSMKKEKKRKITITTGLREENKN